MKLEKTLLVLSITAVLFLEITQTVQNEIIMNSSKNEIKEIAEQSIEAVKNGEASALETYIEARKQEEYYKKLAEAVKELAIEEREQYPEKSLILNETKIELSYSGDRLNYNEDNTFNQLDSALKQRQKELKEAYNSNNTHVDCDGVEVPKVGIKTHGKRIIKLSY